MNFETTMVQVPGQTHELVGLKIKGNNTTTRVPVHLVVAIDTSGSMQGDKIKSVKNSMKYMLDFLTASDKLSIVSFDTSAKIVATEMDMTSDNKTKVSGLISEIKADGATNIEDVFNTVRKILEKSESSSKENAKWTSTNILNMISMKGLSSLTDVAAAPAAAVQTQVAQTYKTGFLFLTDGEATVGNQNEQFLISLAKKLQNSKSSLTTHTVGYGSDHNVNLLRMIANDTGGSYDVVEKESAVAEVFGTILGGLVSCIAENVTIEYPGNWIAQTSYIIKDGAIYIGDVYSEAELFVLFDVTAVTAVTAPPPTFNPYGEYGFTIRGNLLETGKVFNHTFHFKNTLNTDQISYIVAYTRVKVATMLGLVSEWQRHRIPETKNNLKNVLKVLKTLVESLQVATSKYASILMLEIKTMNDTLDGKNDEDEGIANCMLQHSSALAGGKGGNFSATRGYVAAAGGSDRLDNLRSYAAILSQNVSQTRTAKGMKTASQTPYASMNPAQPHQIAAAPSLDADIHYGNDLLAASSEGLD